MTSLRDDARETLMIAGLEKAKERSLEQHLSLRAITRPASRKLDATCQRLNKFIDSFGSREVHSCTTVLARTDGESARSSGADVRAVSHRAAIVWLVGARYGPQNGKTCFAVIHGMTARLAMHFHEHSPF